MKDPRFPLVPGIAAFPLTFLLLSACSSSNDASPTTGTSALPLNGGTPIVSGIGGKCLDDSRDETTDFNKIQIWECNGSGAQAWTYTNGAIVGPGGKCLDIHSDDQVADTVVDLYGCNGTKAQQWTVEGTQIKSTAGLCLDVRHGVNANGTQVQVHPCNGTDSQVWKTTFASGSGSGSNTEPSECEPLHPTTVPPGAAALKYETQAFFLQPTTADISYTNATTTALSSGSYYSQSAPGPSYYSMKDGALAISLKGYVTTEKRSSEAGKLPFLLAGNGFYVEFAARLSDNNRDHWPAVWLLPQEHNLAKSDHLSSDPEGYERWMEIDVDEGGFYDGSLSTLISWEGTYPNYESTAWNDFGKLAALDRTVEHVFGVSYDPKAELIQYWLDGVATFSHSTSAINDIINTYHYYLIMNASSHSKDDGVPYEMYVCYASAWIP